MYPFMDADTYHYISNEGLLHGLPDIRDTTTHMTRDRDKVNCQVCLSVMNAARAWSDHCERW